MVSIGRATPSALVVWHRFPLLVLGFRFIPVSGQTFVAGDAVTGAIRPAS